MKTPTLKEVKEHFKDAEKVRCIYNDKEYELKNIGFEEEEYNFYYTGKYLNSSTCSDDYAGLWSASYGYAEITKYKSTKPKRYKSREVNGMDVIDLVKHWNLNFNEGNILKYLLRDKGEDIQDLEKIIDYATREKEHKNNLINK